LPHLVDRWHGDARAAIGLERHQMVVHQMLKSLAHERSADADHVGEVRGQTVLLQRKRVKRDTIKHRRAHHQRKAA